MNSYVGYGANGMIGDMNPNDEHTGKDGGYNNYSLMFDVDPTITVGSLIEFEININDSNGNTWVRTFNVEVK